jgi:hypothetical protein
VNHAEFLLGLVTSVEFDEVLAAVAKARMASLRQYRDGAAARPAVRLGGNGHTDIGRALLL